MSPFDLEPMNAVAALGCAVWGTLLADLVWDYVTGQIEL